MKNVIKKIVRLGVPETNSSSSHSLCICMEGSLCNLGDECWDFDIRDEGKVLYIPKPDMIFDRNFFSSNHCLLKTQYAFGLALSRQPEAQKTIIKVLKGVTGVDEVKIEWVEEYKKELETKPARYIYVSSPYVDHNSTDLFDEAFENEEVLKNFIFSPYSWLYGGDDSYSEEEIGSYYSTMVNNPNDEGGYLEVDFGGKLGKIDIILDNVTQFCSTDKSSSGLLSMLGAADTDKIKGLYYDSEKKEVGYLLRDSKKTTIPDTYFVSLRIFEDNSKIYLGLVKQDQDLISVLKSNARDDLEEFYDSGGIDETLFEASIYSNKYGKIL